MPGERGDIHIFASTWAVHRAGQMHRRMGTWACLLLTWIPLDSASILCS